MWLVRAKVKNEKYYYFNVCLLNDVDDLSKLVSYLDDEYGINNLQEDKRSSDKIILKNDRDVITISKIEIL